MGLNKAVLRFQGLVLNSPDDMVDLGGKECVGEVGKTE